MGGKDFLFFLTCEYSHIHLAGSSIEHAILAYIGEALLNEALILDFPLITLLNQ
jgi:hypothetical protein